MNTFISSTSNARVSLCSFPCNYRCHA